MRPLTDPRHLLHMISSRATVLILPLLLATMLTTPGLLSAQVGQQEEGPGGWAPPSLGVHFGYDNRQRSNMLGAQVRLPVLPGGEIELMGSMDVTFLRTLKAYQYNFETVYVLGGRAGGFYGGGGIGLRNSLFPNQTGRSTELGYTAVVGFRIVGLGLIVPQVEYRWIFINEAAFTYQQLTLGASVAPWRHIRGRG